MRSRYMSQARQAEAFRLRDAGTPVARIAEMLGVTERSVWKWLRARPAEPAITRARKLLAEALEVLA